MSFRLFIYYCGLCGAWAALAGWLLGRWLAPEGVVGRAAVLALCLGAAVAPALALVDLLGRTAGRFDLRAAASAVAAATAFGGAGGLLGGLVGQGLYDSFDLPALAAAGWTVAGLLIGTAVGASEVGARLLRREPLVGTPRRLRNGALGGTLGGLVGGVLYLLLRSALATVFGKPADDLVSSSAAGFVVLGASIGLLFGAAHVALKEAWLRVESGFRPGRELILSKPETIIGRAEGCDLGLFGGAGVEKVHARILRQADGFVVVDAQTPGGTYVNGQRLAGPRPLRAGDRIRLGNCELLFRERKK
jgi:hypothetical protein